MPQDPRKLDRYDVREPPSVKRVSLLELEVRRQRLRAELKDSDFYRKIWTLNNIRLPWAP